MLFCDGRGLETRVSLSFWVPCCSASLVMPGACGGATAPPTNLRKFHQTCRVGSRRMIARARVVPARPPSPPTPPASQALVIGAGSFFLDRTYTGTFSRSRRLQKIKQERADEAAEREAVKEADAELTRQDVYMKGNPLLNAQAAAGISGDFSVTRRSAVTELVGIVGVGGSGDRVLLGWGLGARLKAPEPPVLRRRGCCMVEAMPPRPHIEPRHCSETPSMGIACWFCGGLPCCCAVGSAGGTTTLSSRTAPS